MDAGGLCQWFIGNGTHQEENKHPSKPHHLHFSDAPHCRMPMRHVVMLTIVQCSWITCEAGLCCAVLCCAVLCCAVLCCAALCVAEAKQCNLLSCQCSVTCTTESGFKRHSAPKGTKAFSKTPPQQKAIDEARQAFILPSHAEKAPGPTCLHPSSAHPCPIHSKGRKVVPHQRHSGVEQSPLQ